MMFWKTGCNCLPGCMGKAARKHREGFVISQRVPLFTLQGNLDVKKLHGIYHSAGDYYRIRFDSIWSIQI